MVLGSRRITPSDERAAEGFAFVLQKESAKGMTQKYYVSPWNRECFALTL
jgi:hypothetical protein